MDYRIKIYKVNFLAHTNNSRFNSDIGHYLDLLGLGFLGDDSGETFCHTFTVWDFTATPSRAANPPKRTPFVLIFEIAADWLGANSLAVDTLGSGWAIDFDALEAAGLLCLFRADFYPLVS